jgi:hypothetical protein
MSPAHCNDPVFDITQWTALHVGSIVVPQHHSLRLVAYCVARSYELAAVMQGVEQDVLASAAAVLEQAGNSGSILRPIPSWSSRHPLVSKKAGLRESGLVFAPGKSWFLGLFLMVVSLLVLGVTLATL